MTNEGRVMRGVGVGSELWGDGVRELVVGGCSGGGVGVGGGGGEGYVEVWDMEQR